MTLIWQVIDQKWVKVRPKLASKMLTGVAKELSSLPYAIRPSVDPRRHPKLALGALGLRDATSFPGRQNYICAAAEGAGRLERSFCLNRLKPDPVFAKFGPEQY